MAAVVIPAPELGEHALGVRQLVDIHVVAVDRVQPADELKRRLPANTHERCFASDEA